MDYYLRIRDIFNMAGVCGWSHMELHNAAIKQVFEPLQERTKGGKRRYTLEQYGNARGYYQALYDQLERHDVEFCYTYKGELYSTHRQTNKKSVEHLYTIGADFNSLHNAHYWKNSNKQF